MTERTGQTADPADPEVLRHAVTQQGIFLGLQFNLLTRITSVQEDLVSRIKDITRTLNKFSGLIPKHAVSAPPPISGNNATSASTLIPENVRLQPEPFFGDVSACGGFLLQCDLIFQQAPRYYQADHARISLIVNSLRSKALQWAQAFLASHPITHLPFERFLGEFRLVFDRPRRQEEATRRLLSLKQGNRPVSEHLIDFRIFAVEAGWPDPALKGIFYQSLNERIKDHLCTQPETDTFEELVTAALRSDLRLRERQTEQKSVHAFQYMYGCEWDDETGEVKGYRQYGYDGEDFIVYDLKMESWTAPKQQAEITKHKWENDKDFMAFLKNYLSQECPEWLKKYVNDGRSSLMRKVLPSVSLLQKSSSSPVSCHATGFYPDRAELLWRRDGEEVHEGVEKGPILPNNDGTFQMSVDLQLPSGEDMQRYECVFQLSGLKEDVITKLEKAKIRTNEGSSSLMLIIIGVLAAVVAVILSVSAFILYKKKNAKRPPSPVPNREIQMEMLPPGDSPA